MRTCNRNGNGPSAIPRRAEILHYLNHVADRFDLRKDIRFDTRVESAVFNEDGSALASGMLMTGRRFPPVF